MVTSGLGVGSGVVVTMGSAFGSLDLAPLVSAKVERPVCGEMWGEMWATRQQVKKASRQAAAYHS